MAQTTDADATDGLHPVFGENRDENDYDDLADRAIRARTEMMVVLPQTDADDECTGMFDVHSASGSSYVVDLREGVCDCPDMTHNLDPDAGEKCKHLRRVALLIQHTDLPAPGESAGDYYDALDALDADLRDDQESVAEQVETLTQLLDALSAAEHA